MTKLKACIEFTRRDYYDELIAILQLSKKENEDFNHRTIDKLQNCMFLESVNVEESWIRNGLATQLINEAIEYCKLCKFDYIVLESRAYGHRAMTTNQLRRMYKKFGFERVGRTNYMLLKLD